MDKEITIGIKKLIAMFVVAKGEFNGEEFEYFPKLPKPFSENLTIKFPKCVFKGDLLSLRVNNQFGVELWFIDNNEEQYYFDWEAINIKKMLKSYEKILDLGKKDISLHCQ